MKPTNMQLGKAGELRVMSELLLRGFEPAIVLNDNGIDLILSTGQTIQVKTANKTLPYWRYCFNLSRGKNTQRCNFLICWCIEDDKFLIIPTKDNSTKNWKISSDALNGVNIKYNQKRNLEFVDNWEVLRESSSS